MWQWHSLTWQLGRLGSWGWKMFFFKLRGHCTCYRPLLKCVYMFLPPWHFDDDLPIPLFHWQHSEHFPLDLPMAKTLPGQNRPHTPPSVAHNVDGPNPIPIPIHASNSNCYILLQIVAYCYQDQEGSNNEGKETGLKWFKWSKWLTGRMANQIILKIEIFKFFHPQFFG